MAGQLATLDAGSAGLATDDPRPVRQDAVCGPLCEVRHQFPTSTTVVSCEHGDTKRLLAKWRLRGIRVGEASHLGPVRRRSFFPSSRSRVCSRGETVHDVSSDDEVLVPTARESDDEPLLPGFSLPWDRWRSTGIAPVDGEV